MSELKRPKWANKSGAAAILFDMAVEFGIPHPENRVLLRKNAMGHSREKDFVKLLDEEETSRKSFFLGRIQEMIDLRVYPSKAKYHWLFVIRQFYPRPFQFNSISYYGKVKFKTEQLRWLEEYLPQQGWLIGGGKFIPPADWTEDKDFLNAGVKGE